MSNELYDAVAKDNIELATQLIKDGANVNEKNEIGNSPLHISTFLDSIKMCTLLLDNKADVDMANDKNEQTPLMIGAFYMRVEAVKLLLTYNANKNLVDKYNATALDIAKRSENTEIIELLS